MHAKFVNANSLYFKETKIPRAKWKEEIYRQVLYRSERFKRLKNIDIRSIHK